MKCRVTLVGPFPPPVHGQAIATQQLCAHLQQHCESVTRFDTSSGSWIRKLAKHFLAAIYILVSRQSSVYISLNARRGMWLTLLLVGCCRVRRARVTIHHHTLDHIQNSKGAMRLIVAVGGARLCHLTICSAMTDDLKETYPRIETTLTLSNAFFVEAAADSIRKERGDSDEFVIGHLSNLSEGKGISEVYETFCTAKAAGTVDKLLLAGPCSDSTAEAILKRAEAENGEALRYFGPVYDDEKQAFYERIDAFLLPSHSETQGIVNLEALAAGVPVIATGLCCIPRDLTDSGGLAMSTDECLVKQAVSELSEIRKDRTNRSAMARKRFLQLKQMAEGELRQVIDHLCRV